MNRLGMVGRALLVSVVCLSLVLAGCSTDWIGQAEEIVGALIPAAGNLITLVAALEGKTVSANDLQIVQSAGTQATADLQLIQSLIAAYEKADASAKAGILSQIQAAIQGVQTNLQGLLAALHIKDTATQAKVTAVIGIVLSEVQSLAAILPIVQGGVMKASVAGTKRPPLGASAFVSSYNATLSAKTGNADVDRVAAGLKIHAHGVVARVVSGGVVK